MIVLDASACAELLLDTRDRGARVRERLSGADGGVHVPHLFDVEVVSALRRLERSGSLGPARATQALDVLADLPLVRYPHWPLQARVWALREKLTPYDALYVALAEALDGVLLTGDRKLAGVPGLEIAIEVID